MRTAKTSETGLGKTIRHKSRPNRQQFISTRSKPNRSGALITHPFSLSLFLFISLSLSPGTNPQSTRASAMGTGEPWQAEQKHERQSVLREAPCGKPKAPFRTSSGMLGDLPGTMSNRLAHDATHDSYTTSSERETQSRLGKHDN